MHDMCNHQSCEKFASFNKKGSKKAIFCSSHKEVGMVNIKRRKCSSPDCEKIAHYNKVGEKLGLYCSSHKEAGMINVRATICVYNSCNKIPNFNKPGETKPLYCSSHKEVGMINVKTKRCIHPMCDKIPHYNEIGKIVGIYCVSHKKENMVNVRIEICNHLGCQKQATFNHPGKKKSLYCSEHRENGMIDKNRKCLHKDCMVQPNFNIPGEKKGIYCASHKIDGMVNVTSTTCQHDGCTKQPRFNKKGEKRGIYCSEHKDDSMIGVAYALCEYENCNIRANYGYPGTKPSFCSKHHPDGTLKNSSRRCQGDEKEDCKETASHGPNRTTLVHCEQHALPSEICLTEKKCPKCSRIDILTKEGLCVNFCSIEESYRVFRKRVKQKEEAIGKLLQERIDVPIYSNDKIIDPSCSRNRPDFVYNLGTHILVIEVDEDQHNGYTCSAYGSDKDGKMKGEMIRMFQIGQCFEGLPVLFIRYNPDKYKGANNATQKVRQEVLIQWVKHCLEFKEWMKGFIVKYLFYDGYNSSCSKWDEVSMIL